MSVDTYGRGSDMNRTDVQNAKFYRTKISKRCAVKTIVDIAEIVLPHGTCSFYEGLYSPGTYDASISNMVDKIRHLKQDAEKYHALRRILSDTVRD